MNLLTIIRLSCKNFKNNQKRFISIILIALSASLVFFAISYNQAIHNDWENKRKSLVDFRTYFVIYDSQKYTQKEAIDKLEQYQYVSGAASSSSYLISMIANDYVDNNRNGSIYLEGTSKDELQAMVEGQLNDTIEYENIIVCAKQFYPKTELRMIDYNDNNTIDISNQVGKTMSLSFLGEPTEKEFFNLVGVYDARKHYAEGNVCYTNFSTVASLNKKYQSNVFTNNKLGNPIIMVIDNVDHSDFVLQEIRKEGFSFTNAVMQINTKNENQFCIKLLLAAIVIIVITVIINFIKNLKDIETEEKYYVVMQELGYTNKQAIKIRFFEHLITGFVSFLLSIPFAFIMIFIIKEFYFSSKIMYLNVKFLVNPYALLSAVLVCFLTFIAFSFIPTYKIKK